MFCPKCGVKITYGQQWCTNCGSNLSQAFDEYEEMQHGQEDIASLNDAKPERQDVQEDPKMPNPSTYMALIVVGFLCGVIWGAIGLSQYGALKDAVAQGDAETANKKASTIRIVTIIGVCIQLFLLMAMCGRASSMSYRY